MTYLIEQNGSHSDQSSHLLCVIVILGQNYGAFMGESIDWNGVLVSYIGLPLFLVLWLGYKFTKTKVIPLDKCELK